MPAASTASCACSSWKARIPARCGFQRSVRRGDMSAESAKVILSPWTCVLRTSPQNPASPRAWRRMRTTARPGWRTIGTAAAQIGGKWLRKACRALRERASRRIKPAFRRTEYGRERSWRGKQKSPLPFALAGRFCRLGLPAHKTVPAVFWRRRFFFARSDKRAAQARGGVRHGAPQTPVRTPPSTAGGVYFLPSSIRSHSQHISTQCATCGSFAFSSGCISFDSAVPCFP